MGKLPTLKPREMAALLEARGFAEVRQRGSHKQYRSVPGLPGCWSQGADEAEALANIETAIREYLQVAEELAQGSEIREIEVAV